MRSFWKRSQTKIWSYCQVAGAAVLGVVPEIDKAVSDPHIKDYLDKLTLPFYVIGGLAVIGILTYVFHGHDD